MEVVFITDMGKCRDVNEDSCIYMEFGGEWNLLMVADGMGGHNAGEVASNMAVESITGYIKENIKDNDTIDNAVYILREAIQEANRTIHLESLNNSDCTGMGTTVTAAVIYENVMMIGHVGDSRAYLLRDCTLRRLTHDHSLVAELVKNGTITETEAEHHPQKNIITRALGTDESVEIDIENIEIQTGDIILLCTDGLTNMLSDKEIEDMLLHCEDADAAAHSMIELANERGGYDNITVVVGKVSCPDGEVK